LLGAEFLLAEWREWEEWTVAMRIGARWSLDEVRLACGITSGSGCQEIHETSFSSSILFLMRQR
jgi:hypothetical protein